MFLISAGAYRIGLGTSWPHERSLQLRVVALNVALALLLSRLSPMLLAMIEIIIDDRWSTLREDVAPWLAFRLSWMSWVRRA